MQGMALRKILCPIDFSPGSERAMHAAVHIANQQGAELVLAHAWYVPPIAYAGEMAFPGDVVQQMCDDARRELDVATRAAIALGARQVSSKLLSGLPWSTLVGVLEDAAFDLVVIGTHGRSGLSHILLGSVAEKLVRHAPCSVLAVRPDGEPRAFTSVLCPVDFSDSSKHATELAAMLVRPGGSGITLLHVIELPVAYSGAPPMADFVRDLDKDASSALEQWASQLRTQVTVPVTTSSRIGHPGAQTLAAIERDPQIDLVVMGSHGRTGLSRLVLGSVAEKTVRHARCPVLVARKRP